MITHPCTCSYVPSFILNKLGQTGRESARRSFQRSQALREQRGARQREQIASEVAMAPMLSEARRRVFDSQGRWQTRVELVRDEGADATVDEVVNQVYVFAGVVRDYFQQQLNRNSIDNMGMNLILNVHFGDAFDNAFWNGAEMVFGDGDGELFVSFARSLDVIAHELAHGVTENTAQLDYFGQSGALNEHFSDVFGAAITQHFLGQDAGSADWLIGNEIMGPDLFGESLRSMKAPGAAYDHPLMGKDPQPDHMRKFFKGSMDSGGVHINSGIPNKVFYRVSMEYGTPKAVAIWYEALRRLWNSAVFKDFAEVLVASTRHLTKTGQLPEGAVQTVRLALREVGL